MTSPVDICNRALGEIAARVIINSFDDPGPAALAARLNYDTVRRKLLRTAPWNFARKQIALSQLNVASTPPGVPFPWVFEYAYPSDCVKFRYLLVMPEGWPFPVQPDAPPQVGTTPLFPYYPVSRRARYLESSDLDPSSNKQRKVLLSNAPCAIGVYSYDCSVCDQFDEAFTDALVAILAEKFIMPCTGNVQLKGSFYQLAKERIMDARVADGNEGLPTTDHTPDWISVREFSGDWYYSGMPPFGQGVLGCSWDNLEWGN